MKRRVYELPTHLHDRIVVYMREAELTNEVEAVRRLLSYALDQFETTETLSDRLSSLPLDEALREACGHPLVAKICMLPVTEIEFTNGDSLVIGAAA